MNPSSVPNARGFYPGQSGPPAVGGVIIPGGTTGGTTTTTMTGLDLNRRKQINTLRIFNENVSEVLPDSEYRVGFCLSDDRTEASIHVFLPPGFPFAAKPSLVVGPKAALEALSGHPWVDPGGAVVGAPGLVNFSVHSDLGRVVQVVKRELAKAPTTTGAAPNATKCPSSSSSSSVVRAPHPPLGTTGKAFSAHQLHVPRPGPSVLPPAGTPTSQPCAAAPKRQTYVSSLTGLDELPEEELREIASSDSAARAFCREMNNPTRDRHGRMIDETREQVEGLLHQNADLELQVDARREALAGKVRQAAETRREVEGLRAAAAEGARSLSPSVMVDRMKISSLEAEEASDQVAEAFLSGDLDVDRFLKDYVSARSLVHMRKAKLDQMRRLRRARN